jgi:hypothetical protein
MLLRRCAVLQRVSRRQMAIFLDAASLTSVPALGEKNQATFHSLR